ncbi:MAG: alpha/beta hydrolase [Nannocystis sp.]|nr:alpha/beta hydrolase [Nannocystis sp.]
MQRWRGLKALLHDAVDRTTEEIEAGHESSARAVMRVLGALDRIADPARRVDEARRGATRGVLRTLRGINRAIEAATDAGLDLHGATARARGIERAAPAPVAMRSDTTRTAPWLADAALGLVNGAIGDALDARGNGLDLTMALRYGDVYLDLDAEAPLRELAAATPRVAIFVHGLATTEWSWCLGSAAYHGDPAATFGTMLARDLGYTALYLRYNSGRHISQNGRLLAQKLQRLVDAYPAGVDELVLIGHSMGGLVVRSACHYAALDRLDWVTRVRRVFCLGSPHRGAPLAKLGHLMTAALGAIDTPGTTIPARLLAARSAGIKDLSRGGLVDEDWLGRDLDALQAPAIREIPLLDPIAYHFIAATLTRDPRHPVGQLIGDLLVRVPSARGPSSERHAFPIDTHHHGGVLHHQLQNHPAVYAQILAACAAD